MCAASREGHSMANAAQVKANESVAWLPDRKDTLREMGFTECGHPYHRVSWIGSGNEGRKCCLCGASLGDHGIWFGGKISFPIMWTFIDEHWPAQAANSGGHG